MPKGLAMVYRKSKAVKKTMSRQMNMFGEMLLGNMTGHNPKGIKMYGKKSKSRGGIC